MTTHQQEEAKTAEEAVRPAYAIYAARFSGTTDAHVYTAKVPAKQNTYTPYGTDLRPKLWMISVCGSQTSTRAIRANFLKGEEIIIAPVNEEGDTIYQYTERMVRAETESSWTWMEQRLPGTKAYQTLVYPKIAELAYPMTEFLMFNRPSRITPASPSGSPSGPLGDEPDENTQKDPGSESELAIQHYRRLNQRVELPMYPSWAQWLWDRARENDEATSLAGVRLGGWYCNPNVEMLTQELSEAVKYGILRVPDERREVR